MKTLVVWSLLVALAASGSVKAQVKVDEGLADYRPISEVNGTIKSVGSDTMNNLMTLWSEGFRKFYPNVRIEIEGKGSSTAPVALINGTANFGPMSREMKADEENEFERRFGYKPLQLPSCLDMLAVYVHKDNPIARQGLTLEQVDAIFSINRKLGAEKNIRTWGQVGLTGVWANKPISLYGRNSASGTYGYFKEVALGNGDFKPAVKEQPGSSAVVQGVARDESGIGYSGIGYKTADVTAVPLAELEGDEYVPASAEFAYSGDYPLSRNLWLSINYQPNSQLDPLRREFVKYVFSKQGQTAVIKDGYFPVSAQVAAEALKMVGIDSQADL